MAFRGLKIRWVNFLVNRVYAGTRLKNFERKRRLLNSLGHDIAEGTKVVGPVFCTGKLVVGRNCWLGKNLTVNGNGVVAMGDNCDIAPEVSFQTGSHEIAGRERRAGEGFTKGIKVGDGCWIGARSTVLPGVVISDGSVVASCACVARDVPANTLVGGVPAREIRKLGDD